MPIPGLLRPADSLGVPSVATGHYVRKVRVGDDWHLAEGVDPRRDQSDALYRLTPTQIARLEFPTGTLDKATVRRIAREAGLPVADKASSVDLCFAKTAGGIGNLVATARPETGRPGPLLDEHGQIVGSHHGIAHVTIGQRSGLQWRRTTPERRYVSSIDPETGVVTVARREQITTRSARLDDPIFHAPVPTRAVQARTRYQGPRLDVLLTGDTVTFVTPGPPLAPGQAIVLYDGPRVLGGGAATDVARGGEADGEGVGKMSAVAPGA